MAIVHSRSKLINFGCSVRWSAPVHGRDLASRRKTMITTPTGNTKPIFFTGLITWIVLTAIVTLVSIPFTACTPDNVWCSIAYGFTSSGGPTGFFVMLVITSVCYATSAATWREKAFKFLRSLIMLVAVFGILAFVNERYTKPVLKLQRPSHVFMLDKTGLAQKIDSLYQLDKKTRGQFFDQLIKDNPAVFRDIDTDILAHWVEEAGFSFPSGHTFNAFLFAMILSYAILFNRSYPALRKLYFLPFVWALLVGISRVAMGAHTALDVSAGAALGIFFGALFLYIDNTRYWLTGKQ